MSQRQPTPVASLSSNGRIWGFCLGPHLLVVSKVPLLWAPVSSSRMRTSIALLAGYYLNPVKTNLGYPRINIWSKEIAPESRLNWCLPVWSGISSLKPAKTHTVAFAGIHLASWIENPARFKQADRQAEEDSRADGFPQVSGGAPGPHRERALSTPGLSSALILKTATLSWRELEGHQPPQADLTPLPLL